MIICFISLLLPIGCAANKLVDTPDETNHVIMTRHETHDTSPFVLGMGDEILINVWRNEDLSRAIKIDPAGNIFIPLAGEIRASGLTVSQLREEVTLRLSKYLVNPQVDINVTTVKSLKFHTLGEVESPGTFVLDQEMLIWEAIPAAGGFTDDANKEHVLLVRREGDAVRVRALDIGGILRGKVSYDRIYLRDGDIVYVMPTKIAEVEKFMLRVENIIKPILTLGRTVIYWDQAIDVLQGGTPRTVIAP